MTITTFYLDDKNVESLDDILSQVGRNNSNNNNNNNSNNQGDNTTAHGEIPQAGIVPIVVILAIVVLLIGGISYYRLKNIDR